MNRAFQTWPARFLVLGLFIFMQSSTASGCGCDEPTNGSNGANGSANGANGGGDGGGPALDSGPLADGGPMQDAGPGGEDGGVTIEPVGGVNLTHADARACDLVFQAAQPEVPSVSFASEVQGRFVSRAPLLSVSFIARDDATLQGVEILQFNYVQAPGAVSLVKADCFDGSGNALSGSVVEFLP
jgi:hypothetical protein